MITEYRPIKPDMLRWKKNIDSLVSGCDNVRNNNEAGYEIGWYIFTSEIYYSTHASCTNYIDNGWLNNIYDLNYAEFRATTHYLEWEPRSTRFVVKPEGVWPSAMHFWLYFTIMGVNENLGTRGIRGGLTHPPPHRNRALEARITDTRTRAAKLSKMSNHEIKKHKHGNTNAKLSLNSHI